MRSSLLTSMALSADKALEQVLLRGAPRMQNPPSAEVGFVAAVVMGGIQGIANAWVPCLKSYGYSLRLHGVFCHGAPLVKFRSASSGHRDRCELADLLVVADQVDQSGQPIRRMASLIQAKMAARARRVTFNMVSGKRQLYLYQKWPVFSFEDSAYGCKSYSLMSICNRNAGSFGVIDQHFKNSPKSPPMWTQHDPEPTPDCLANTPTLGEFLAQMILGNGVTCGRIAFPKGTDDWSQVVDLLLRVTYQKTFKHKGTFGPYEPPRGVMAFLNRAQWPQQRSISRDWQPPFDGFEIIEDGEPGGISILKIEVSYGHL